MRVISSINIFLSDLFRRKRPIHLLVDGDQLASGITQNAIKALAGAGYEPVSPIKVFCNQHGLYSWKDSQQGFEVIVVPQGKDMADTHIIMECGKLLAGSKLKAIAVLSGDAIFAATATAIKRNGGFPILLAPASKVNFETFTKSHALCIALDDVPEEALSAAPIAPALPANTQPKKTKKLRKDSNAWIRRDAVINQLKNEPLAVSLGYLEDVADTACVGLKGEQTLPQMLQGHPDIRVFKKGGLQYAVHVDHDEEVEGNVVSIGG